MSAKKKRLDAESPQHAVPEQSHDSAGMAGAAERAFQQYAHPILVAYGLVAALSIAASQILIVPLLALWLVGYRARKKPSRLAFERHALQAPLLVWLAAALLSVAISVDFFKSLSELLKTAFYLLLPFAVADSLCCERLAAAEVLRRIRVYVLALCGGLGVAALHSVSTSAAGFELPPKIPGALTESGQLVLVLPTLVGLMLVALQRLGADAASPASRPTFRQTSLGGGALVFLFAILTAWSGLLALEQPWLLQTFAGIGLVVLLTITSATLFTHSTDTNPFQPFSTGAGFFRALTLLAGLLFASLLINLKRGPWAAVIIELVLIGALFSRKLILATISISALTIALLEPARERLGSLVDHFLIYGGRSSMWKLGAEIVGRFPLGVGIGNAAYMRVLDPTLPRAHRHMHNNVLNIAVETGLIGLAAYLWWMVVAVSLGALLWHKTRRSASLLDREAGMVALFFSIALLGWQLSGLVEYNFGDGEIRLIAFFFMGLVLALCGARSSTKQAP
ncbi:MAG: O-antigen ligase family protein [Bdellovibrionales bacterium]|nr:O-antigen ligase family protein [Bdellovibrionales bacterium]